MQIKEGMAWPPNNYLSWKMAEHSAWYSGSPEVLANFYTEYVRNNFLQVPYPLQNKELFWGRQIQNQGETFVHVPIAGDIAETSADLLFSEPPLIKVAEAHDKQTGGAYKAAQEALSDMLEKTAVFRKLLEAAEAGAALGGIYIKLAWDRELSELPIPVVEQADRAIPEFKFGILTAVTFWKVVDIDESGSKVYRLLERYERGYIRYELYLGTSDKLGRKVELSAHSETGELEEAIETGIEDVLAVYIPNMLPNRLDRASNLGRSDLSGIEGLMDSLDEVFSSWMRDVAIAQGTIHVPEAYLEKAGRDSHRFNRDRSVYVKLDIDPTTLGGKDTITATQFAIRADEFEKTALNILERIITSAGYSPQSFGLNIQGRAESGTALNIRERKSLATKVKKESYWKPAINKLVHLMLQLDNVQLGGTHELDITVNTEFSDSITNNLSELATSVKMLSDAMASSTDTKVRLLHPDWSEDQVAAEVKLILEENNIGGIGNPDGNWDLAQLGLGGSEGSEEGEE